MRWGEPHVVRWICSEWAYAFRSFCDEGEVCIPLEFSAWTEKRNLRSHGACDGVTVLTAQGVKSWPYEPLIELFAQPSPYAFDSRREPQSSWLVDNWIDSYTDAYEAWSYHGRRTHSVIAIERWFSGENDW